MFDCEIFFPKQCRHSDGKHWVLVNQTYTHLTEQGLQELFKRLIFVKGAQGKNKAKQKNRQEIADGSTRKTHCPELKICSFQVSYAVISQTSPCAGVQNF